jgi:hypothetical protein
MAGGWSRSVPILLFFSRLIIVIFMPESSHMKLIMLPSKNTEISQHFFQIFYISAVNSVWKEKQMKVILKYYLCKWIRKGKLDRIFRGSKEVRSWIHWSLANLTTSRMMNFGDWPDTLGRYNNSNLLNREKDMSVTSSCRSKRGI